MAQTVASLGVGTGKGRRSGEGGEGDQRELVKLRFGLSSSRVQMATQYLKLP